MIRFAHISGIYAFDGEGNLKEKRLFDDAEIEEFLHAKAIRDTETLARIIERSGIGGIDPTPEQLVKILASFSMDQQLRSANLRLTKQQLRESIRPDLLIINTSNAIEELDKVANTLVKRLREWYALYDPELEHNYKDHRAFVEAILTRTTDRAEDTMGGQLGEPDLQIIIKEAKAVQDLYAQRDELLAYLELIMEQHTPNLKRLGGSTIGAKLLAMAGSLERLSRMPSSTIQLLGAETALFRHLRNKRSKPPKHGIIFNHVLLQRAPRQDRGKAARALADKLSIAAKIDFFRGEFIGDALYRQVEERIRQ